MESGIFSAMEIDVYKLIRPMGPGVPILLSSPHSGTYIPADIAAQMDPKLVAQVPDTDFFVHELYSFGPEEGMSLIHAQLSRYVIDLNRDPDGAKLYADDRQETSLVPVQSFAGQRIYPQTSPDRAAIDARLQKFFLPYYAAIEAQLAEIKATFGFAILWDCHSIKRSVPSIRNEAFPDVILGNQDGRTCHPDLFAVATSELEKGGLRLSQNHPFKGGHLTRYFGRPDKGIHALQLEMSQDVYMNEIDNSRNPQKQARVAEILRATLKKVTEVATQCLK